MKVVYGVGGGMVGDAAKYVGWKKGLPVVLIPTSLSQDGFFTALVANRTDGTVNYITTGPVEKMIIDWEVIRAAPAERSRRGDYRTPDDCHRHPRLALCG